MKREILRQAIDALLALRDCDELGHDGLLHWCPEWTRHRGGRLVPCKAPQCVQARAAVAALEAELRGDE